MQYIMALDQGTTSSRCILFDRQGKICAVAQQEFPQIYPQPGWVEHDPMQLWQTVVTVAQAAMDQCGATAENIGRHRHHEPAGDDDLLGQGHRHPDL